jgi:hypothetical protein
MHLIGQWSLNSSGSEVKSKPHYYFWKSFILFFAFRDLFGSVQVLFSVKVLTSLQRYFHGEYSIRSNTSRDKTTQKFWIILE